MENFVKVHLVEKMEIKRIKRVRSEEGFSDGCFRGHAGKSSKIGNVSTLFLCCNQDIKRLILVLFDVRGQHSERSGVIIQLF